MKKNEDNNFKKALKNQIIIYTDGSSLGNPGSSGWGAIFLTDKKAYEISGYQKLATNNQMELEALKQSFKLMIDKNISNYKVDIFSDSKYCINGLEKWITNWKKNNWKTAANKDVLNKEYWLEISDMKSYLEKENEINFFYVKAHSGEKYNERVDDLARWSAEKKNFKKFNGKIEEYLKND